MKYLPATFTALQKANTTHDKRICKDANGQYHYMQAVAGGRFGGVPYRDGTYEYYGERTPAGMMTKSYRPLSSILCIEMGIVEKK